VRRSRIRRKTKETDVEVEVNLDGSGKANVDTGIKFLNHMLESLAKHGCMDLKVKARGDLKHHVAEDVMICLGLALEKALGDKVGIRRMGDAVVPMDDALALVAVDLGGRAYSRIDVKFRKKQLEDLSSDLLIHLLETLSFNGSFNLHVEVLCGRSDHHKAEAVFKALGLALGEAVSRGKGSGIPSTKGVI